jgi:hypothetical protein
MRKLLPALAGVLFMSCVVLADEYTIGSYDKDTKTLTFKDKDGKEVKGKITDDTKVYRFDKDGNKQEGKVDQLIAGLEKAGDKLAGRKVDATIKDGKITEYTSKGGKGKN